MRVNWFYSRPVSFLHGRGRSQRRHVLLRQQAEQSATSCSHTHTQHLQSQENHWPSMWWNTRVIHLQDAERGRWLSDPRCCCFASVHDVLSQGRGTDVCIRIGLQHLFLISFYITIWTSTVCLEHCTARTVFTVDMHWKKFQVVNKTDIFWVSFTRKYFFQCSCVKI